MELHGTLPHRDLHGKSRGGSVGRPVDVGSRCGLSRSAVRLVLCSGLFSDRAVPPNAVCPRDVNKSSLDVRRIRVNLVFIPIRVTGNSKPRDVSSLLFCFSVRVFFGNFGRILKFRSCFEDYLRFRIIS